MRRLPSIAKRAQTPARSASVILQGPRPDADDSTDEFIDDTPSPSDLPIDIAPARDGVQPDRQRHGNLPEHGSQASLWWEPRVVDRLRPNSQALFVDAQQLVLDALAHSLHVQALSQTAHIRAEDIIRAEAEFDPTAFIESKFADISNPVGNTLVTGGPNRLNEHDWNFDAGFRRKLLSGATVQLSQQMGHKNSNSVFFIPQDQGNARLTLSFNQPLLNGAGKAYNTSLIFLAQLNTQIASDEFNAELQEHLLEVNRTYWRLYMERVILLQKQRHLERAQEILEELESRLEIDALQSQIVRARAAVASREAELVRARFAVRNVESRLRTLINSPALAIQNSPEVIPQELPFRDQLEVEIPNAIQIALSNRPEIDEAMQRIHAATVRWNMSRNELMPALGLIVETYAAGLEGKSRVGRSLVEQFDTGAPSYTAGLLFEMPIYNRAASARLRQREMELRQVTLEFNNTVETLSAEVEVAVREVRAAYQEMLAKYSAMSASVAEVRYLRERWELLPGDDRSSSLLLEDILNAQERLMDEESTFVRAQVEYAKSLAGLRRATGTLMGIDQLPRGPRNTGLNLPTSRSNPRKPTNQNARHQADLGGTHSSTGDVSLWRLPRTSG